MISANLLRLSMLFFVAGCATQTKTVANEGPDVQCHAEQATGSLISKTVCTTRAQREAQQNDLSEVRRVIESQAGASPRPSGPTGH